MKPYKNLQLSKIMLNTQQYNDVNIAEEQEILPSISIVVPNYNGEKTIEATLISLIEQNYPKLEIIVVDGASCDNSVKIIKQYEQHITWWVSEKDSGQSNAINKGFAKCSGEIINWLCSDDILMPGALYTVGKHFASSPDVDILLGRGKVIFTDVNFRQSNSSVNFWLTWAGRFLRLGDPSIIQNSENSNTYIKAPTPQQLSLISLNNPISQPSCFYRSRLLNRPLPIDESYNYAMDTELWNYFYSQNAKWKCVDDVLSVSIQDGQNKTSTGGYKITLELEQIYKTYTQEWIPLTFWHRRLRYPLERFLGLHPSRFWLYLIAPLWLSITLILAPFYGLKRVWYLRWKRWV